MHTPLERAQGHALILGAAHLARYAALVRRFDGCATQPARVRATAQWGRPVAAIPPKKGAGDPILECKAKILECKAKIEFLALQNYWPCRNQSSLTLIKYSLGWLVRLHILCRHRESLTLQVAQGVLYKL